MPVTTPTAQAVERAAAASSLQRRLELTPDADLDELRYRDEVEAGGDPAEGVASWLSRKELPEKLTWDLERAGLEPHGTIVELGAGTCWLGATLALRPEVERVIAVEFSGWRLERLAPAAIAALSAPAEKIERVLADFYAHGIEPETADMVFMDAAFHHASDPVKIARIAYDLLRPGGTFVLFREPTLALLRRRSPVRAEDEHGEFEREYDWWQYLRFLRAAGFKATKHRASVGFRTRKARGYVTPPFAWLNGIRFANYTFVGRKPA